jgi:hypothetical protein
MKACNLVTMDIKLFFEEKVPSEWFLGPPTIAYDEEEILCVGVLTPGATIARFREETRPKRMAIAEEAQSLFGRRVSWGVEIDGVTTLFTNYSSPVTTSLRIRERAVLDTLIDAGIAVSRNEALAWCVKLVARHQAEWLTELREALVSADQFQAAEPTLI